MRAMRKSTRVPTVALVAAVLMCLTLSGCAADTPAKPYSFKHSINGDDLVPLTADQLSQDKD
jgi:hypothetical protein